MGKLPSGLTAKASALKTGHKGLVGKFTAPKASKPGYLLVASSNHNVLNQRARQVGATAAARSAVGGKIPVGVKTPAGGKTSAGGKVPAVFTPGLKPVSLERVADQPDATFNRVWRDLLPAHDELFSTSLARETLKGFLSVRPSATLSSDEHAGLTRLMNLVSDARIPTRFAGYSTADRVVQHPTGETGGLFAERATASAHAEVDRARKEHAVRAMEQAAVDPQSDAEAIVRAGLMAAIEFSLNEFIAPVTASNVHPFSRLSARPASVSDPEMRAQLQARDLMKQLYVKLGGTLRPAPDGEMTSEQGAARFWWQSSEPKTAAGLGIRRSPSAVRLRPGSP